MGDVSKDYLVLVQEGPSNRSGATDCARDRTGSVVTMEEVERLRRPAQHSVRDCGREKEARRRQQWKL